MTFQILEDEIHPDAWSAGLIKPIYKKGDNQQDRRITLMPVMSRIFSAVLESRLSFWADLLNEAQFGFRKLKAEEPCTDAIYCVIVYSYTVI